MTRIRRFMGVAAVLGVTAILTSTQVWGEPGKNDKERRSQTVTPAVSAQPGSDVGEDLAGAKFAAGGVLTYQTRDQELLFALQVKPKLEAAAPRPVDYLCMVDTSASQVGVPLANAQKIVGELVAAAGKDDRVSIWTVNIPDPKATIDLTRGFKSAQSGSVREALKQLKDQVPLGDTDLNQGIAKATATFTVEPNRQRVLLFLGDGMSIHNPITPADRARLCEEMAKAEIAFFPVPLGPALDPQNLHGLASGTGGKVIRVLPTDKIADTMKRLHATVAAPILYPIAFKVNHPDVQDVFPTRLPPLRGDAPTLVIGKLKDAKELEYTVEGTIAGHEVKVRQSEEMKGAELDNFFLVGMFEQWKNAKDQPALMRADRALAYAQEVNQFARVELLAQAEQALAKDKLDAAAKLFGRVKDLDPNDVEAGGGLKVVEKLRLGQLTKEQLRQQLTNTDRMMVKIGKNNGAGQGNVTVSKGRFDQLLAQAEPVAPPKATGSNGPPPDANDLLKQQRQRQIIEEQKITQTVDESLREARRLLRTDPDGARDILKRTLANIRDNFELNDAIRGALSSRLENSLRNTEIEGASIRRDQTEQLRLLASAQERFSQQAARVAVEERTQGRMRVFHNLMDQGRFEDAYRQALDITKDAISQGAPVPVAVTAAHDIGLTASNLQEFQEVKRVREERYLLTMLQVEKSHIPFPDEPGIQFPPAATWRELTRLRKERYESSGLTEEDPAALQRLRQLRDSLSKPVTFDFDPGPLKDALGYLSERYNIPIIVDTEAFKSEGVNEVENAPVKLQKLSGVSLSTILRLLLSQVQGTYIIRREYVEVTTGTRQAAEKTIRVYPVADLVIPIPNSINQAGVNQAIQNSILGFQLSLAQTTIGGLTGLGGLGGLAGIGGLGGLGGGLAGIGGLGGLGGGLGGLGGGLGGIGGGGLGGLGGLGGGIGGVAGLGGAGGGPQNLGVGGGGAAGFAGFGGQLGQTGNLGGQFGLQGGDQSAILIKLITQVVGTPRDWAPINIFNRAQTGQPTTAGQVPEDEPAGEPNEAGAIGYYPPSRALIVKGTSRIHTRLGGGLLGAKAGGPPPDNKVGALDQIKQDFHARSGGKGDPLDKFKNNGPGDKQKDQTLLSKNTSKEPSDLDARKIWQEALAKGVKDPGLIIAVADFLAEHKKFTHAAEFLKANLRQAIVVRPWVYEALAIALKESGGASVQEIERAELSVVDWQPQNAQGFLLASRTMADNKRFDRAVAFCRQASTLEPNAPQAYSEALAYAESAKDTKTMEWAAGNLLSRDWPVDSQDLHAKAQDKLRSLSRLLQADNRQAEADRMAAAVNRHQVRDLAIHLTWQGDADLDLEVKEPIGTVNSCLNRQTPGGGILIGDTVADRFHETYSAAQAFAGDYEITVRRIWGRPLGSKATLEIIEHQGTPEESRQRETIVFDRTHTMTIALGEGRRKSLAQVSSAATRRPKSEVAQVENSDRILNKLRSLADPELGALDSGMTGGMGSAGVPAQNPTGFSTADIARMDRMAFQGKLPSAISSGMDMTAKAMVSADGKFMRLSVDPVFQTATAAANSPAVNNPLIPGGDLPPEN